MLLEENVSGKINNELKRRKLIMATKPNYTEWMCTQCGRKERRGINSGRPMPGTCSKKMVNLIHG